MAARDTDSDDASGPRAVILLSGGLDSGVALAEWCTRGGTVALALTCDYGQRAAEREALAATRLAHRFGAPWCLVDLPWLGEVARRAGSTLIAGTPPLPQGTPAAPGDQRSAAAVWVPARNLVLCAVAAAYAEELGAEAIVAGLNREEAETFPDNSPEFAAAATSVLRYACRGPVRVESPIQGLDKVGIVARARAHGLTQADFWSCYDDGGEPCGRCESCARSARAWGG